MILAATCADGKHGNRADDTCSCVCHSRAIQSAHPLKLTTLQIGRMGEMLVQYKLLQHGIDSAAMTTDVGVDLVVYAPTCSRSFTMQVKANLSPKPGGGKGA